MKLAYVVELMDEITRLHLGLDFFCGMAENVQEQPLDFPLLHLDTPEQAEGTGVWTLQIAILYKLEEGHNSARITQLQSTAADKANAFIAAIENEYTDTNSYLETSEITNNPQIIMVPDFEYSGTLCCGARLEVNLSLIDVDTCDGSTVHTSINLGVDFDIRDFF